MKKPVISLAAATVILAAGISPAHADNPTGAEALAEPHEVSAIVLAAPGTAAGQNNHHNGETATGTSTSDETETRNDPTKTEIKDSDKDGLTGGQIAGIVIGVVAVIAALAGGAFWAIQQGLIPNPAPGLIPGPAPKPAPRPAPKPAPRPAPKPAPAPAPKPAPAPAPNPAPRPAPAPARPAPAPAPAKTYANCRAVWNDLGRPIRRNEPGYGSHLDRDGDGVGCEKRPR